MNNAETVTVKVLLVDDKPANLYSLQELLDEGNSKVTFLKASSGQEALKIAFHEQIALILLDVQMPEMDGYEVAKILKENKKTRNIPLIFVTALNQEAGYVLEGFEKGAVDYLFKPLDPAIAKAKVKAFINIYLQQKELEQKNIALENLSMLVNNAMDFMCILDEKDLKLQIVNPAWEKQLGLDENVILNKPFGDLVHFAHQDPQTLLYQAKTEGKEVVSFEIQIKNDRNQVKWVSWTMVYWNQKWYGNGKDITVRKMEEERMEKVNEELEAKVKERTSDLISANESLQKTNAHLDTIVYTASHDLKLPINNLEGLLSLLGKQLEGGDERTKSILAMCAQSVGKLRETIQELISLIKIQDEEITLENVSCKDVIEDIKLSIHELIQQTNARIITDFNGCDQIKLTKPALKSIFYNLTSNAIKYSAQDRQPEVFIQTTRNGKYVKIIVEDNGLGIDEEGKKHLFTRFKRLHSHVEGSGMGLYIVKKTVESAGGDIEVESQLGKGTRFTIFLPL
jgi:PAS domain S-box-containing protein